ncbi:hypothetical protein ZIOFF_044924 [Zingiber officinale]|uniref:Uncharacterized protein n=1 Tax=Zingiber officinale TaxID=94328 RepID=A0A8J5G300_ZINOF|nr:hypothetical protein ZIOFF_044924 [Zingiber officinale]
MGLEGGTVVVSSRKQVCFAPLLYGYNFFVFGKLLFSHRSAFPRLGEQNNVDEAVEKLRSKGIEVIGAVCHVSNPQHRKDLMEKTVQVRVPFRKAMGRSRLSGSFSCGTIEVGLVDSRIIGKVEFSCELGEKEVPGVFSVPSPGASNEACAGMVNSSILLPRTFLLE